MSRVYNFSAGPAVLPEAVLQSAAAALREAHQRQTEREAGDLQSELARRRAAMKRKN